MTGEEVIEQLLAEIRRCHNEGLLERQGGVEFALTVAAPLLDELRTSGFCPIEFGNDLSLRAEGA